MSPLSFDLPGKKEKKNNNKKIKIKKKTKKLNLFSSQFPEINSDARNEIFTEFRIEMFLEENLKNTQFWFIRGTSARKIEIFSSFLPGKTTIRIRVKLLI